MSSSSSAPNSGSIAATITAKSTLMAGAKGGASQLSSPLFTFGAGSGSAVRPPPPPPARDTAAQLRDLADLKQQGLLTDQEFAEQKAKILGH